MEIYSKVFDFLPFEARTIREDVFVKEQGFTEEFDSVDNGAKHIVAFSEGHAIGTCRVFRRSDNSTFILGRLAVVGEFRGRGIGRYLIDQAEALAINNSIITIVLHAQCSARGFYEKCGYNTFGEIDYEEECPHIWMRKVLSKLYDA